MKRRVMQAMLVILLGVLVSPGVPARAEDGRGPFVGASVGSGVQKLDIGTSDFQDTTTTWKAFAGYRVVKFFAVEASYFDFGKAGDMVPLGGGQEHVTITTRGETLELVGTLPIGRSFEFNAKAGVLWWDSKLDSPSLSDTSSGSDNVYGGGATVRFGRRTGVRLEYERFDIKDTKTVTLTAIGFEWRF